MGTAVGIGGTVPHMCTRTCCGTHPGWGGAALAHLGDLGAAPDIFHPEEVLQGLVYALIQNNHFPVEVVQGFLHLDK